MDAEPAEESPANEPQRQKRGFALLTPDQRRAVAAHGGRAAHQLGAAHEFTSDEARAAGHIGGAVLSKSRGRAYMVEMGRRGGLARAVRQKDKETTSNQPSRPDGWPQSPVEFAEKLRQELEQRGLRRSHLAKLARVSLGTLRNIDRGLCIASPEQRRRIIRKLPPIAAQPAIPLDPKPADGDRPSAVKP